MTSLKNAQDYAAKNLSTLVAELRLWQRGGKLPAPGRFRRLASLCEHASEGDEFQEAERIVVRAALDRTCVATDSEFDALWAQQGSDGEAYDVARQWYEIGRSVKTEQQ